MVEVRVLDMDDPRVHQVMPDPGWSVEDVAQELADVHNRFHPQNHTEASFFIPHAIRLFTICRAGFAQAKKPTATLKPTFYSSASFHVESITDDEVAYKIQMPGGPPEVFLDLGIVMQWNEGKWSDSLPIGNLRDFDDLMVLSRHPNGKLSIFYHDTPFRDEVMRRFRLGSHIESLKNRFKQVRDHLWKEALPIAEKRGKAAERDRTRKASDEYKAKKAEINRTKAQERMSEAFVKGDLSRVYKNYTPEQFWEVYQIAARVAHDIAEIRKWQNMNHAVADVMRFEDVKAAYDLADVKTVHNT